MKITEEVKKYREEHPRCRTFSMHIRTEIVGIVKQKENHIMEV